MSDNKYINAYVDIAIGTIHEYLAANIQLKAQNKVANDLISEKDKVISSLQADIATINKNNTDMQAIQANAKVWEDSYNAMKNKVAHVDALANQIVEMKREITKKDDIIKELEDKIVQLNKKSKKKQPVMETEETKEVSQTFKVAIANNTAKEKLPIDDF